MIQRAIEAVQEFMELNPEALDDEQMIDLDDHHSVIFSLGSDGGFTRVEAEPPYFEGAVKIYPRFAFLLRFDLLGILQEQIDIKNKIAPHIERA